MVSKNTRFVYNWLDWDIILLEVKLFFFFFGQQIGTTRKKDNTHTSLYTTWEKDYIKVLLIFHFTSACLVFFCLLSDSHFQPINHTASKLLSWAAVMLRCLSQSHLIFCHSLTSCRGGLEQEWFFILNSLNCVCCVLRMSSIKQRKIQNYNRPVWEARRGLFLCSSMVLAAHDFIKVDHFA